MSLDASTPLRELDILVLDDLFREPHLDFEIASALTAIREVFCMRVRVEVNLRLFRFQRLPTFPPIPPPVNEKDSGPGKTRRTSPPHTPIILRASFTDR